jgi:S-layer protein
LDVGGSTVKTLNLTTATADSAFALNAAGVTTLAVAGTNAVDLTGSTLTALTTVTVSGTAGLTLVPSGTGLTSVTTTTTGTVAATIASDVATYTGGAGVDNVTFSNTTAATKAVSLGAGDDKVTVKTGTTLTTPVAAIDGGDGTDTLAMAAADAAAASVAYAGKFTNFEKLSVGAAVTGAANTVDMSVMNNYKYVISAGSATAALPTGVATDGAAGSAEFSIYTFTAGLAAGESFTIDGLTVTGTGAGGNAAAVEAVFVSGVSTATLIVSGSYATPSGWTGTPTASNVAGTLKLLNGAVGNVTDLTAASGVGTGTLTLTKVADASTLELTGPAATTTVTMLDATSLTADSYNIVTKLSTANMNYGTVAVAGVETITINAVDTKPTASGSASIQTATMTLSDPAVKAITVTGNANLTLTNTDNVALATLNASALTGKLVATTNGTVAETITGGTAADTLTALNTSSTADVLIGGAGNDTFNTNKGLSTLTGGAGVDTFNVAVASLNVNSYSTITDATTGDIIKFAGTVGAFTASKTVLGSTAVFQDYANAATVGAATNGMAWFQYTGDTYIIKDVDASTSGFVNNVDIIVKLTGLVDLSHASYSTLNGTIELGA